jgi:hypothetical protein
MPYGLAPPVSDPHAGCKREDKGEDRGKMMKYKFFYNFTMIVQTGAV